MFEITRIQRDRFLLDKRLVQQSEKQQLPLCLAFSCAFLNNSFRRSRSRPGFFLVFANFQVLNKREVFKIRFTRFNGNSFEAFQHCVSSRRNQRRRWSDFVAQERCQTHFRTGSSNIGSVLRSQYSVFRSCTCPQHSVRTMRHLLNEL
jgi:hypothetical protein